MPIPGVLDMLLEDLNVVIFLFVFVYLFLKAFSIQQRSDGSSLLRGVLGSDEVGDWHAH